MVRKYSREDPDDALFAGMFPLHACLNHSCANNVEVRVFILPFLVFRHSHIGLSHFYSLSTFSYTFQPFYTIFRHSHIRFSLFYTIFRHSHIRFSLLWYLSTFSYTFQPFYGIFRHSHIRFSLFIVFYDILIYVSAFFIVSFDILIYVSAFLWYLSTFSYT